MSLKYLVILSFIIILGVFLRFYDLGNTPNGIHMDEAIQGYNAYSMLLTGKDEYGKYFPIYFRSFGNFQSSLYTYLTIIPIYLFDLSIFSTRFVSALMGVFLIIITFLIIYRAIRKIKLALIASLILVISPWAVFFSRMALEAHVGLFLTALGTLFLVESLKKSGFLIIAGIVLAISTYAYHGERILAVIYLLVFIVFFWERFKRAKILILITFIVFFTIQIPQWALLNTQGVNTRFRQVNYLSIESFQRNGGELREMPLGYYLYINKQFFSRYLTYFSPRSLFSEHDPQTAWSMVDMSTFYWWMVFPYLIGLILFFKRWKEDLFKVLILLLLISPIPAALTREEFYTLRAMPTLWVLTIIISLGIYELLKLKFFPLLKYVMVIGIFIISLISFYISYFIVFKYERAEDFGYSYIQVAKKSEELKDKSFLIDNSRSPSVYIYFTFFRKIDPLKMQNQPRSKEVLAHYYLSNPGDPNNRVEVENITTELLVWGKDKCKENIIVGDYLTVSEKQAKDHNLIQVFAVNGVDGREVLKGYLSNPEKDCLINSL